MSDRVDLIQLEMFVTKLRRELHHAIKMKNMGYAEDPAMIEIENALLAYFGLI